MRPAILWLPLITLACSDQTTFRQTDWQTETLTENRQTLELRRSMVDDIIRRFRAGIPKADVIQALGPNEQEVDCDYPDADSCVAYHLGIRPGSIDYEVLLVRFRRDRLVAASVREF
jgi:hypothetical protein